MHACANEFEQLTCIATSTQIIAPARFPCVIDHLGLAMVKAKADKAKERVKLKRKPTPSGSFLAGSFTDSVRQFENRQQALEELGCNVRCTGHCPRAVKKSGKVTFLKCKLRDSTPACTWSAIIREAADSSCEMLQHPTEWREHNAASGPLGSRGFKKLEERASLCKLLTSTPTAKPTTALRAARLGKTARQVQLKQVQKLKKSIVKRNFACSTFGQLRATIAKSKAVPARNTAGYFCHSFVTPPGAKKPKLTVIATTRILQKRWVECPDAVASADGGFKFTVLGWPLHVLGTVNPAGTFTLHALGLTSSMEHEHVADMLKGFKDSTVRVTGCGAGGVKKALAMSDAEGAYRKGLANNFESSNLMCFFHVKQAAKENLMKRFVGTSEEKKNAWQAVSADIDLAHGAFTAPDFLSRCQGIRTKWEKEGLHNKTTWTDIKSGRSYDFVASFFQQWTQECPEWYIGAAGGAMAPCTNNGAESCVKNTRVDAGNLVASVGEVLKFVLQQVEHVSLNEFDPNEMRTLSFEIF